MQDQSNHSKVSHCLQLMLRCSHKMFDYLKHNSVFDMHQAMMQASCRVGVHGNRTNGNTTNGNTTNGNTTNGNRTNGHRTDGNRTDGNRTKVWLIGMLARLLSNVSRVLRYGCNGQASCLQMRS